MSGMSTLSLEFAVVLVRYVCVLITLLFVGLRWPQLQRGLDPNDRNVWGSLAWVVILSFAAIVDDHTAWTLDVDTGRFVPRQLGVPLRSGQAIIDLRDLITAIAGLAGGFRVGLLVGMISGANRYWIGGNFGQAAALATIVIGIVCAWLQQRFPGVHQKPLLAVLIGVLITLLQRLVLAGDYLLLEGHTLHELLPLLTAITLPKAVTNMVGCALFAWVMQVAATDSKARMHERILAEKDRELSRHLIGSYLGQAEPHFLYNTLNNIRGVYIRDGVERGDAALVRLAEFFRVTHTFTDRTLISLDKELEHVRGYVELRQLGFGNRLQFNADVPSELRHFMLPPHAVLTLVENSVKYALQDGRVLVMHLTVAANAPGVLLRFKDNGPGYATELLQRLGQEWIESEGVGTGTALYALKRTLRLLYGENATIDFHNAVTGGAVTTISMPLRAEP